MAGGGDCVGSPFAADAIARLKIGWRVLVRFSSIHFLFPIMLMSVHPAILISMPGLSCSTQPRLNIFAIALGLNQSGRVTGISSTSSPLSFLSPFSVPLNVGL